MMQSLADRKTYEQAYAIFSVDAEHDIISRYRTKTAGWSIGNSLLLEVFDSSNVKGKICWLLEYNLKEDIVASNPSSDFFVEDFHDQIKELLSRGDELGLHPSMMDWIGGERRISKNSYNYADLWDFTRSYHDRIFVENLITSGVREFKNSCGTNPTGCRTGAFQYATHLAAALKKNGIFTDSSVNRTSLRQKVRSPNAYYASINNIYKYANINTGLVEIPATGYVISGWEYFLLKYLTYNMLRLQRPIFLSIFIHNWQAAAHNGGPDRNFLKSLASFLRFLEDRGVRFLTWTEANKKFNEIYGKNYRSKNSNEGQNDNK